MRNSQENREQVGERQPVEGHRVTHDGVSHTCRETPKECLFMWVIIIDIVHIRN